MKRINLRPDTRTLSHFREEVHRENRSALRYLALAGLPLSIINFICQIIVVGWSFAARMSLLMLIYFIILHLLDLYVIPEDDPHPTQHLYLASAPAMLMAVLLGSVWDPSHQAITILLFVLVLPAFTLDYPWRTLTVLAGWSGLFIVFCLLFKDPSLYKADIVHVIEFYLGSAILSNVLLRVRLASLKHLENSRFHLEHDQTTNCLNRAALESRTESLVGREITVVLVDLDQFMLYHDFYGHKVGASIMQFFTETLMKLFGAERCFHYAGDEFLCVLDGASEDLLLEKVNACREALQGYSYEDTRLGLSCAFGYTTGKPKNAEELREMIQLADINSHKAKKAGPSGLLGCVYDQENLHHAIVDSNLLTHAHSYEVNQLTGLPGMSFFVARADALLKHVAEQDRRPVVGYFKLVNMRGINNELGYARGDELIADTAKLLMEQFEGRYLCHITAGQFGIICYRDEVEPALARVNEALRSWQPGYPIRSRTGLAEYTGEESVIVLMDRARLASRSIRGKKDITFRYYDEKMAEEALFSQYLTSHVDEAIEKGWLQVYYQPIARAITGHVCAEEALSRWDDPNYGFLMPYRFIPTLEEHGLMHKVNLHVVRQVLRDMQKRRELGVPVVPVSVNLSRRDFEQRDMVGEICRLVDEAGVAREMLKIEITESAFVADQDLLFKAVGHFREKGFDVWLDDFGSEYSTLNLLQDLDFSLIKLDMQFMRNFTVEGKNFIIISDVIDMAKRMGITTLIEGVETEEQRSILNKLGCELIQGYLFNRPNSFDYIARRALSGTGLTFEDPAAAPYYEAIGRIDLNEPMNRSLEEDTPQYDNEIPSGIVEMDGKIFRFLRGTDSFARLLSAWGLFASAVSAEEFRELSNALSDDFIAAAHRCADTGDWKSFALSTRLSGDFTVYVRRVSPFRYHGTLALLVVLLPDRG